MLVSQAGPGQRAAMFRSGIIMAIAALFSVLFTPPGFMPDTGADGGIVIRICSEIEGDHDLIVRVNPKTGEREVVPQADDHGSKRCDFAGSGWADVPSFAWFGVELALPTPVEAAALPAIAAYLSNGLPPSTGPPSA